MNGRYMYKEWWDKHAPGFHDHEVTIARTQLSYYPTSGSPIPQPFMEAFDENDNHVWGIWPIYQHLPIEEGRFRCRTYHLSGSLTILTEKIG